MRHRIKVVGVQCKAGLFKRSQVRILVQNAGGIDVGYRRRSEPTGEAQELLYF